MDYSLPGSYVHDDSPGKNTGVGCHTLLQRIFPTQGLNLGLPHFRHFLDHLSHQGGPRILEWASIPSAGDVPDPGTEPGSPALQADSLPAEPPGNLKYDINESIHETYRVTDIENRLVVAKEEGAQFSSVQSLSRVRLFATP